MDITMLVVMLESWVVRLFPSMAEYTKYIGPAIMAFFTLMGIFTNILPEPKSKFVVPNVAELEAELQGGGGFILRIAKFTRTLIISANWFIGTAMYSWFYNTTNTISKIVPKFSKKTKA